MIWLCVVAVSVLIAAVASIWGGIKDYRDLQSGNPSFVSLVSYTGIWDRNKLAQVIGDPGPDSHFALPAGMVEKLPISWWVRLFDNRISDVACIILALIVPFLWTQNRTLAFALIGTATCFQFIGYAVAATVMYRSGVWRELFSDE